jgi:hypothetical protein
MSRLGRIAALAGLFLACAIPVCATYAGDDPTEFRCPKPGTTIRTTLKTSIALRNGPTFHCVALIDGHEIDTIALLFDGSPEKAAVSPSDLMKLWPLNVGKSTDFVTGLPLTPFVNRVEVVGRKSIDISAGHFDTYVIEWTVMSAMTGRSGLQFFRYYFAPRIAAVIKFEYEGYRSAGKIPNWEATEISIPREAATSPMA